MTSTARLSSLSPLTKAVVLGSVVSDLKKAYPNATFKDALSIYGHNVRTSGKKSVEGWLKKLGM